MLADLIPALLAAFVVAVVPGYFWAACLCGGDIASRVAYGIGFSITLVPAVALIPARFFGLGVTFYTAVFSVLLVFICGLIAYLKLGPAKSPEEPVSPPPVPFGPLALVPLLLLLGLVLTVLLEVVAPERVASPLALLAILAGAAYLLENRSVTPAERHAIPVSGASRVLRGLALVVVLALVAARGCLGPARHDWPFLRGTDQFNHGVMANEMLSSGAYENYLVYPPGFHTVIACVSRFSGLCDRWRSSRSSLRCS